LRAYHAASGVTPAWGVGDLYVRKTPEVRIRYRPDAGLHTAFGTLSGGARSRRHTNTTRDMHGSYGGSPGSGGEPARNYSVSPEQFSMLMKGTTVHEKARIWLRPAPADLHAGAGWLRQGRRKLHQHTTTKR